MKDWKETTLGEIAEINPSETLKAGTVAKYVAMQHLTPFAREITQYEAKEFKGGSKFRNGDTLLARITPCLENGKTAFVDFLEENEVAFGSTEFIVIREKKEASDKNFLFYFALSPVFREAAIKSMTGTSGRQRVQTDLIADKQFSFPPLPEQKAIAAVLSSFDDKIELLRRQNKTLEKIARTTFKEWFVNFTVNGKKLKIENSIGLPEGWRQKGLDEIADFLNGLAMQKYPPENKEDELPVIKIRELKSGITDQTDKASKKIAPEYIVDNGDVLFSWSGSLGIVLWYYGKGALNQHLFKVSSKKYPKWFYYFWILEHLPFFRSIAQTKATTMGHIQRHHLAEALVAVPDDDFMAFADSKISPVFEHIISNNSQIQTLSKLRDTLLPKLMKGEIRVKVDK